MGTPLSALPIPFAWADNDEAAEEADRQPDGCMDHEHMLKAALAVKSHQYDAVVQAALRAQAIVPNDQCTVKTVTRKATA
eukprot:1972407-Rhodomonas_salina.1